MAVFLKLYFDFQSNLFNSKAVTNENKQTMDSVFQVQRRGAAG